jgi:hypothetical protein
MPNNIAPSIVSSSETPFNCLLAGPLCEGAAAGPRGRTQTGRQFRTRSECYKLAKAGFSNNGFPETLTDSGILESHCSVFEGFETVRIPANSATGHDANERRARCCLKGSEWSG